MTIIDSNYFIFTLPPPQLTHSIIGAAVAVGAGLVLIGWVGLAIWSKIQSIKARRLERPADNE